MNERMRASKTGERERGGRGGRGVIGQREREWGGGASDSKIAAKERERGRERQFQ